MISGPLILLNIIKLTGLFIICFNLKFEFGAQNKIILIVNHPIPEDLKKMNWNYSRKMEDAAVPYTTSKPSYLQLDIQHMGLVFVVVIVNYLSEGLMRKKMTKKSVKLITHFEILHWHESWKSSIKMLAEKFF